MASILDRYGIKEVADVTFYEIGSDGKPTTPVLFLDTLKVSTIEQNAEQADARGGKGNPKLVTWDYGKEISVSIEDALFSPKSLAMMFGTNTVGAKSTRFVQRTATIRLEDSGSTAIAAEKFFYADIYDPTVGSKRVKLYFGDEGDIQNGMVLLNDQISFTDNGIETGNKSQLYDEDGRSLDAEFSLTDLQAIGSTGATDWNGSSLGTKPTVTSTLGHKVMFTYWVKTTATEIVINGDSFPGTYYVTGDTYARSDISGKDQFFQFIIPKAKVSSEQTITLEAEGDPSVFNMNLTVLRPEDGDMMKLVQYDLAK